MTKERRNAQLAALLEEGRSYEEVAKIAGLTPQTLKLTMKQWYPELYLRLRKSQGRPSKSADELRAEAEKVKERARRKRRKKAERDKRHREIAYALFADPDRTLEDVGEEFGITRERVRQIASKFPAQYEQRRQERKRRTKKHQPRPPVYCKVCGEQITDSRTRYCNERHYQIHVFYLRYHLNEKYRGQIKTATAKWVLRNRDKASDNAIRHAERTLDPDVTTEERGRWITENSGTMEAALECYENDYPVFYELPPEIQQQVKNVHASRQQSE